MLIAIIWKTGLESKLIFTSNYHKKIPLLCTMFLRTMFKSFVFAWNGIVYFFANERNAKVHLVAGVMVIVLGFWVDLSNSDWLWIGAAITLVWVCEMCNTAIERLCNKITLDKDEDIKIIKDISAGFVLLAALFSVLVGVMVFSKYL